MILRRKLLPLNFAEGDPPAAAGAGAGGGAETRGACPVCQSEITCAGGVIRGGAPSSHYTELAAERDRVQELTRRISDLERQIAEGAPAPEPTPPEPAPKAKAKTFL